MDQKAWRSSAPVQWFSLPSDEEADLYRLLAYIQRLDRHYRDNKLYPYLDDLRERLVQLQELRRKRSELEAGMPREITGMDLRRREVERAAIQPDEVLRSVDAMISYSLPELSGAWERGTQLRARFVAGIRIEPVGLMPLYTREGYLLIHSGREARAYAYTLALPAIAHDDQPHHVLRTRFVADYTIGISCTYEHVKADLVRRHVHLPNPAVFALSSDVPLPAIETFVPLAKQIVYEVVVPRPDQ